MKPLFIFGLLAGFVLAAQAQDTPSAPEKPVPPPGPLIQARAPQYSRWTMTTFATAGPQAQGGTGDGAQSSAANTIASTTTITKTGDIIHIAWADWNKDVWNIWVQGRLQAFVWPDGKTIGVPAPPPPSIGPKSKLNNQLFQNFTVSDFQGFDWISPASFTGIEKVGGRKCLIFKSTASFLGVSHPLVAATDLETRLPVQLQDGTLTTVYQFQTIGEAMQSPPENVQKFFNSLPHNVSSSVSTPAPY
jgi:hypothetical protein